MSWVLVLHENELLQSNVADLLAEVLPFDIQVASNLADATELFDLYGRIHCKLVVSSFSPPVDGNSSQALDRTQVTAIALLKEIRARREQPPWLFLASFDDGSRSEELAGLANVRVLNVLKFGLSLRTEALNLVGGGGLAPRRVDVEISLVDGVYGWSLRGFNGTAIENSGVIDIDPVALGELTKASSGAALADRAGLGQIGLDLYVQFLANNLRSGLELAMSSAVGASLENARFRFCVDEHTNQLLFETLGKPCTRGAPLEHWMLQAPMFRKYRGSGDRFPLFKDRVSQSRPVSCLIIQGESAGFEPLYEMAGGEYVAAKYGAIGQAAVEATMVYRYLTSNYERFGIEQPELLQPGLNENYGDVVRNKLASRRWQLIHYVGHSSMSDSGTAFLALGRGSRDVLEIAELARLASAAQFVYLSSCQSSNAKFVRELVSRSIPAVLGYAWPVQDDVAIRFANSFYQHLFEGGLAKRFLEYAFMRSKRDMHRALPDNTAWAAPLLFMQMLGGESARNH
jgi:CHAT domain